MSGTYLAPKQNPDLNFSEAEQASIARNRRIREKFEAEVAVEEERLQRGLSGDEMAVIRKRLLEEP